MTTVESFSSGAYTDQKIATTDVGGGCTVSHTGLQRSELVCSKCVWECGEGKLNEDDVLDKTGMDVFSNLSAMKWFFFYGDNMTDIVCQTRP